ncbi:hypothetical protein KUTeg_023242 [Tegillarca granosa]|uniref:RNA cytidine acetyltransferase n=1 Tax=Tegillarca granosa TaxID=220873 RepID=A0ABQ9E1N4_TEGGR|nr:hypothetical protein KUTeg_023242 [Tegillarca granosa]
MVRKKIDNRIRVLIENGVAEKHRSMFVVIGDHGRDQVCRFTFMNYNTTVSLIPSVLWCYKKELGFSSHRKKRMKQLQKKIKSGKLDVKEDDPFELFVAATDIRYCYYAETHKILGNTYGMCILQDFEALTPNLLARTIETVEGGGVIVEDSISPHEQELRDLKESLQDTQPVGAVVNCCKTLDQKTLRSTVVMTAARGRGKSAALGLAMATAVGFGYSNIFVTAPSPENLKTLFQFIFKGFDALEYQEHLDYEIIQSTNPEFNKAIMRVNIFREHRQTIQYIHPSDAHKLGQAELVCIDEAAAIPLPLVKELLGPYLVFMSSTVNGYEGTGRSLSLKLIQQLRQQSSTFGRTLYEVVLNDSIRYANNDPVEKWLNEVLCLDATQVQRISSGCPSPQSCDLYYVNRDTLFSYHKASEAFLHRIMSLYVSSHYKNTPNDLQMLSDAPAHHIFVLLGPVDANQSSLPEVLCVLQVCLEGEISKSTIMNSLSRGKRASGDLIPWTVSQQFQDHDFPSLSGARVVRIATHPDYQGDVGLLEERIMPRKDLPPLLLKLSERKPEKLDYIGVSYGLTASLLKFWKKAGYVPVYLRQTPNDLTGEHSCIMLKMLHMEDREEEIEDNTWLSAFWKDFRKRFVSLLAYQFKTFSSSLGLAMLQQKQFKNIEKKKLNSAELENYFTKYDVKRLELYAQNMVDYHLIVDLLPAIGRLYFLGQLDVHFSAVQSGMLLAMALQHKTVDDLEKELDLPASQLLGLFNRLIRKVVQYLNEVLEADVEKEMIQEKEIRMEPVKQTMEEELNEAAEEISTKQKKDLAILKDLDLSQYQIKGSEHEWKSALSGGKKQGLFKMKKEKFGLTQNFLFES